MKAPQMQGTGQDPISSETSIGGISQTTDEDLLKRLAEYDQQASEELYRRYWPRLVKFLYWANDDAEDLAQEVMYDVYRCAPTFRGGSASAWIFAIARNVRADYWRRFVRNSKEQLPEYTDDAGATTQVDVADPITLSPAIKLDIDELMIAAFASLPTVERQSILLTVIKEVPVGEAAEIVGVSAERLKQYTSRAYSSMRQFLIQVMENSKFVTPQQAPANLIPDTPSRGHSPSRAKFCVSSQEQNALLGDLLRSLPTAALRASTGRN